MGRRSKYSSIFKAQVALAGLRGDETMQSLAKRYEVSPSKITEWMRELEKKAAQAFEKPSDSTKELKKIESENKRLLQKVGQLTIDCDFFATACEDAGLKVR
ncbi:transposase [Porphyromonas levii]|uniref:transposase n=1 Tax=Porphyromonas levii TaxID=28114 RepID=UPI001B8B3681|nr:transposase [Porphyromonas levii]MBR8713246.1 hypothetical protein [Porphyromonas levii]MBR8715251.1 hypothetical protein [Porphyromonas levii]MBR8727799.1 hypothetical protein [Porphyromonas levii]MBR8735900.1 hypothetical protein [Porphyromonas levii]MBR8778208.1 hypothetical protein [Porphyromonas levii]